MCRKTGGRQGREDWEKWSAWKEGRERDSDGEKGARGRGGEREGTRRGGLGVYYYLKGSGCCVQINKQEVIAEGLYIYFLS